MKVTRDGKFFASNIIEGQGKISFKKSGDILVEEINEIGLPLRYIRDSVIYPDKETNLWQSIVLSSSLEDIARIGFINGKEVNKSNLPISFQNNNESNSVTIDLREVQPVGLIKIIHSKSVSRSIMRNITEVSFDGQNWMTVYDSQEDKQNHHDSGELTILVQNYGVCKLGKTGHVYTSEYIEV